MPQGREVSTQELAGLCSAGFCPGCEQTSSCQNSKTGPRIHPYGVSAQAPPGGHMQFCSIYHSNSAKGPEPSSASSHHFRQTALALQPTMRMSFINNPSIIHLLKWQSQSDTSWAVWVTETFPSGWVQQWIVLHIFHLCASGSGSLILELVLFSSVCFSYLISDSGQI